MPDTIFNYGDEVTAEELAEELMEKVNNDEATWEIWERSKDPTHFLIFDSGVVEDPVELKGTDFYQELTEWLGE